MALLVAFPPGCVTKALWDTWPTPATLVPAPVPVQLEQAVRTGEGAFHVLATYSDGTTRHLAVRPFETPGDETAWPDAIRRQEIVVEVEGPLPPGAPLRVGDASSGAGECPDDTVESILGDAVDAPGEVISLEGDALRVVNGAGESWTLATFSPDALVEGASSSEDDPARQRVIVVFFTPFALAIDSVVALLVFGPMLPVVAEDLLKLLDGEQEVQRPSRLDRHARAARGVRAVDSDVRSPTSTTTSGRDGGS